MSVCLLFIPILINFFFQCFSSFIVSSGLGACGAVCVSVCVFMIQEDLPWSWVLGVWACVGVSKCERVNE